MSDHVRWGILATGRIAGIFTRGVGHSRTGKVVAVASRTKERAQTFAREQGLNAACHGTYQELLENPDVDAVYIATPHPSHACWAIRAAEAGKHILCEKPLALNHADAVAVVDAAQEHDVFLMEAFMYRCHPQIQRMIELLREGAIGDVRMIEAAFSYDAAFDPKSRIFDPEFGGGGILDVGCYCTSMARLVAGVALGGEIAEPLAVHGAGHAGTTGVDEWAAALLRFPDDIVAQLTTGVRLRNQNLVRIHGTAGRLQVDTPWIPAREGGTTRLRLTPHQGAPRTFRIRTGAWLYGLEADTLARHLARRQPAFPAVTWEDTLGNMRVLDRWREAIGITYPAETAPGRPRPLDGRPLRADGKARMPFARIDGLDRPVSRLVLGVDNQRTISHGFVMFDDYFRRGGNAFDTAYVYANGQCERVLGAWVKARNLREEVVIVDKGAHTPRCTPDGMRQQLRESLDRLNMEYVDIYLLHRDNPDVPVDEFVDALNQERDAGRVRMFGGSNWSLERLQQAQAYALRAGKQGFGAVSNNFSLARMVDPVWAGCRSASEPAFRKWLADTRLPLLAWSSQARGFFVRARPDDRADPELTRCWYSEDNFERLQRARTLAGERGVEALHVALAYVLQQPFPVFALIGPRRPRETFHSLAALPLELTPREQAWLNLEADER